MYKRLPTKEKIRLIKRVEAGEPVAKICREAEVSRTIFYKWLKKYRQAAPRAKKKVLASKVVKGKKHWKRLPARTKRKILKIALENPSFSPEKIGQIVGVSSHGAWNVLKRNGLNTQSTRDAYIYQYGSSLVKTPTVDEKLTMIRQFEAGEKVAYICRDFGISRTAFYKWLKRYQQAPEEKKREVLDSWRPREEKHWRFIPEAKELVLEVVIKQPELSPPKISQKLPLKEGKPILGSHGVYNLLKRLDLNTYEKRLAYAQAQAPVVTPVVGLPDRIKRIIGRIPVISAIPPPTRETIASAFPPFMASFFSSIVFSTIFIFWLRMFSQAPTLGAKLGLFFASMALLIGGFFFAYSMKYYFTLAIVLSFSRQPLEEGGGYAIGLNGRLNNNQKNNHQGSWLERIFGLGEKKRRVQALPVDRQAGGLQPSLDHIRLKRYPFVSVHLPFYNEKKVAERILKACTEIDYPNFEIIVCDDSTDETIEIVQRFADQWNKKTKPDTLNPRPYIKVLHRPTRQGFKGGALSYALKHMDPRTEFVVVFDADFIPYPDTLELFIKYFKVNNNQSENYSKSKIAVVGGYQWHVLNRSENWITRGVRTEYAGSYVIERPGREILGLIKQISGSVYMIRADLLKKIGWGTSITEDFQLTLKLYEQGYKVIYSPYVQAPAECASTLKRLIRQRMRWAEGHSNNIRRMFLRLMSSPKLTLPEKLEVLYLSPYYLQAAFFMVGTFSWIISETVFRARLPFWTSLWGWSLVLTNFFSLPLMNAVGLFLEESEERDYAGIISFIFLSYILVPFQAYASVKGFIEKEEGPWFRTPKTGKITDIFTRRRFYRWVSGIFPGRRPAPALATASSRKRSPYLALATANSRFDRFQIVKRNQRGFVATFLVFLLICSSTLIYLLPTVSTQNTPPVQAQVKIAITDGNDNQAEKSQPTEKEKPKFQVVEHNPKTHPQDFYLDLAKMAEIEAGEELDFSWEKKDFEKEFLPYYYKETESGYQLFIRSEKGIQRYTFAKDSLSFWLGERDDHQLGFVEKAISTPIFQYQNSQGKWQDYIVLVPLDLRLQEFDHYLMFTASFTLFTSGATLLAVPGEMEFKLGFDGNNYINKFSFRLGENENINRLVWETKLLEKGVIEEDRAEVVDEIGLVLDGERQPVKTQELGEVMIDWQDFEGETRCEQSKNENANRVYFYEEGKKGALEIDPTISITVPGDTIEVTVSSEFKIIFDKANLGIDEWYDLENDSEATNNLVDSNTSADELFSERWQTPGGGGCTAGAGWTSGSINTTLIELIENSASRVVVHMEGAMSSPNGNLWGHDRVFTVYPTGLIVLESTVEWEQDNCSDTTAWGLGSSLNWYDSSAWNQIADGDSTPTHNEGVGTDQRWWAQYKSGYGSVLMLEYDWQRQNAFYLYNTNPHSIIYFNDTDDIDLSAGDTIDHIQVAWIRPDTLDDESTNDGYKNDYLNPHTLDNLGSGTAGWFDTDENTSSPSDFWNEEEGTYCLDGTMGATQFAQWDLDGGTNAHYKPVFKIRDWRKSSEPPGVKLEGSTLTDGTDYNLDIAPFSEAWTYDSGATWKKLADGGDDGTPDADEYLNRTDNDFDFDQAAYDIFDNVGDYFYLGSHDQFTGVNLDLDTAGTGSPTLTWQYCSSNSDTTTSCDSWSTLSVTDTDSGASNMTASGNFYFSDPGGWVASTENSGREALWWIRAYRSAGSFTDFPIENTIRTDIILLQYLSDISSNDQTFEILTSLGVTSSSASATGYSFQRKTWYDGDRFWSAFHSGSEIQFWYSEDWGDTWTQNSSATINVSTNDFTIEADSSDAFIAYTDGFDIKANEDSGGYPSTSFAWGTPYTPYNGSSSNDEYDYPAMTKDSNDKIWITARHHGSASPYLYLYHHGSYEYFSDFLGGATSPESEYTDFIDITDRTEIVDNTIKLKISEELNETVYLDQIFLRADGDDRNIIKPSSITKADINLVLISDNDYLVMTQGQEHYLEFPAPTNNNRIEFVTEGYYLVNFNAGGVEEPTELIQRRTLTSKTYQKAPGKYIWEGSIGPIHYKDDSDNPNELWKEINTTVIPSEDGEYDFKNEANSFKSYFKKDSYLPDTVKYQEGGSFITFTLENNELGKLNQVTGYAQDNQFIYPKAYKDIDVKYSIYTTLLLEEFVLYQPKEITKITQRVHFENAYFQEKDGAIIFHSNQTNKPVWQIPQPLMYELNNREKANLGIHYEIKKDGKDYLITKVIDEEGKKWLADEARSYPVVIDTTVNKQVAVSEDDRTDNDDGSRMGVAEAILRVVRLSEGNEWRKHTGARFTGLGMSQGVTIDVAYAEVDVWSATYDDVYCDIYCEDQASPPNFADGSALVQNRTRTSASAEWIADGTGTGWKQSPSLVGPIQEIATDYAVNNLVLLFIADIGTSKSFQFHSWDYTGNLSGPKLHIEYTGATYMFKAIQSQTANAISSWYTASTLDGSSSNLNKYGVIVPLNSGDMYSAWIDGTAIQGCFYDEQTSDRWENSAGSDCTGGANQDSIDTGVSGLTKNMSAVADTTNYDAHLLCISDTGTDTVSYFRWDNGSGTNGTWQSEVVLDTSNDDAYVTISINTLTTDKDDLYAIWIDTNNSYIYYRKCDDSAASSECSDVGDWASEVSWQTSGTNTNVTSNYSGAGMIFAQWTEGTSSPYSIMWDYIIIPEKVLGLLLLAPFLPTWLRKKRKRKAKDEIRS